MVPATFDVPVVARPPRKLVIIGAIVIGLLTAGGMGAGAWLALFKPKPQSTEPMLAAFVQGATSADPIDVALAADNDLRVKTDGVSIERVWMDSCQRPGAGRTPAEECDRQPFFERALVKAIVQNGGCAPERPKDESISFALEIHHRLRKTRLFVGRSGTLRAADAKAAVGCVERALPEPDWENLPHEHTRYVIGVLATYPSEKRQ